MIWRNNKDRYGLVASAMHWAMAVLVVGMLGLGLYMVNQKPSPFLFKLYFYHKSLGITVLALVGLRLGWRATNITPAALPSHKDWEKIAARAVHFLLYLSLLALPLSGWVMSSAKGFSVSVFGWFTLPDLISENKTVADWTTAFHEVVAYSLIILLGMHIAGALKHHFIDRDITLQRMIPGTKLALAACLGSLFALGPVTTKAASEPPVLSWQIDPGQSAIEFEATQMGAPFTGAFASFGGEILFDPARLDQSRVKMWVDTASVTTKSADRDRYLLMPEWLAVEAFPQAGFMADNFSQTGEDSYVAHGDLKIKDVAQSLEVPFTLSLTKDENNRQKAEMTGEFTIPRLSYNIGEGEWKDTSMVGNMVTVTIRLMAYEETDGETDKAPAAKK